MKFQFLKNAALVLALGFTILACDEAKEIGELITETEISTDDSRAEANYPDAEDLGIQVMADNQGDLIQKGVLTDLKKAPKCATGKVDKQTRTITLTFDGTCTGTDGRKRSGKIVIKYSTKVFTTPSDTVWVSTENYTVDSVKVEGKWTIIRQADANQNWVHKGKLENGKLTFSDNSTITRNAEWTRTWLRGANPALDEFELVGTASGTTRKNETYTSTITNKMVWKNSCALFRFYPISGTKTITSSKFNTPITIDYGTGICDNLMTISKNGKTITVPMQRKK